MKNFVTHSNKFGGVDLIIEDDNDNLLAFGTGNAKESREFWLKMKAIAQSNMDQLEENAALISLKESESQHVSIGFMSRLKITR